MRPHVVLGRARPRDNQSAQKLSVRAKFMSSAFRPILFCLVTFYLTLSTEAQWRTSVFPLTNGWNAVYLDVDASHTTLAASVANTPITEIWLWQPSPATGQFFSNVQAPENRDRSPWQSWIRTNTTAATISTLRGNAAYLVRVSNAGSRFYWNVFGRPVPPQHNWTTSGQNFIGFPTVPTNAPTFSSFFAPVPDFRTGLEVYYYPGGETTAPAPQKLANLYFSSPSYAVRRGQAFWIRNTNQFNRHFGAFEIALSNPRGIEFGDNLGQFTFHMRNHHTGPLRITVRLLPSEPAPADMPALAGAPPLLVRGELNATNLTYVSIPLTTTYSWTLQPFNSVGSEVEVVLGLNRAALVQPPKSSLAGILRFTDDLNQLQVDIPVSALVNSTSGLWVGEASIGKVGSYLKSYAKATNATQMTNVLVSLGLSTGGNGTNYVRDTNSNMIMARGANGGGGYLVTNINTTLTNVARPAPLRLIVHNDTNGVCQLLQRVFYGLNVNSNLALAKRQASLDQANLGSARRLSAVHLPWSAINTSWTFDKPLALGQISQLIGANAVKVASDNQAANPFLHTYHPDHDNRDATFKHTEPPGVESYDIERQITLSVTAPRGDFKSLTTAGGTMTGTYSEVITVKGSGTEARDYATEGSFSLTRILDISALTP